MKRFKNIKTNLPRRGTWGTVLKPVGNLLIVLGIVIAIPVFVALIYKEWYSAIGFIISALITSGTGLIIYRTFRKWEDPQSTNVLLVASVGWLALTLMGALPFLVIAYITPIEVMNNFIPIGANYNISSLIYFKNPLHCFFESMSAYTTTGLSMAVHEPSVGKGILFYRHFAQWVGGAGFIVLVLAVFKHVSGKGAILLYGSESTGERLKPRIIDTARAIWKVYLYLTIFSIIYLIIGTHYILPDYPFNENVFDSVCHAMAGQSTGGFSTLDDSIATYNSPYMDMLYLLPMILGSLSIPFFYKFLFERRFSLLWKDIQTRALLIVFIFGSLIQSFLLFKANVVPNPVREGVFQFISAMSTTGWQTSNIGIWNWESVVFIVIVAMVIGGASGATVGGIKMIRAIIIEKGLRWQINKTFISQHTVKNIHLNGKSLSADTWNEEFTKAATLTFMFLAIMLGSSFVTYYLTSGEFSYLNALFESASAQGTVGLSAGISTPEMSPIVESIYIFQMWTGRLEIIPVFALIRAVFKGTDPRRI